MGLFDKFLDAVRLNDEYDEDEDEFFDDDDFEEEEESDKKHFFKRTSSQKEKEPVEEPADRDEEAPVLKTRPEPKTTNYTYVKPKTSSQKVTPMRSKKSAAPAAQMEVCVIKPTRVEDYREIADTLLSNCTVVLNLEGLDVELAQRIIDFSSGSCYAINGGLQKVSSFIFILTPADVEITGDIQDLLNGAIPSMRTSF